MAMPKHIWRCPTREAIDALARRFGLPNYPWMQSWEHEVADHKKLDEFLAAYETSELSDDEKFTLMEIIIDSFEDFARRGGDLASDPRWKRTLTFLDRNIRLHAYSIWYWSCPDAKNEEEVFYASPCIRPILAAHLDYFFEQGNCT
jgi:hypothetical protein